ncbi:response regulator [Pedobacter miscanthi]|uniref:Response regulator n=1 Tax=Pedobacter miscanthi TaxID=2259170 RepID=A0A366KQ26_9SPHI|nr:response regulator [Pedobacter miscanthi]RBQ02892.1 response regulator [Pedobacter miscanthi]
MKKILVVDDNREILEVIELILGTEGYEVNGLWDATKLNQRVADFKPDLILLDVMLGVLDGRDLCNLLKKNKSTDHIPVIMISASHNLGDMNDRYCHPNDFIAKPFDINNLIDKVGTHLVA